MNGLRFGLRGPDFESDAVGAFAVDFATSDGTATAPGDYTSNTGTVTFAPGDRSETVTVQVNGDTAVASSGLATARS